MRSNIFESFKSNLESSPELNTDYFTNGPVGGRSEILDIPVIN